MKTKIKGLLLATGILLTSCGGVKLGQVTNIRFEDGILSFDEVKNAEGYNIKLTQNEEVLYEDKITDHQIDIDSLGLEGEIEFEISAFKGNTVGEVSTYLLL